MIPHSQHMGRKQGFTLIELMIVVVIIGLLAAMAIPRFTLVSTKAREKEADTLLKQIYNLQASYFAKEGYYAPTVVALTDVGWSPPTSLQGYALPEIIAGGGPGATMYTACMAAVAGGLDNRSINEVGDISTC